MYVQRVAIGGFANANYWSSMEYDGDVAWYQNRLVRLNNRYFSYVFVGDSSPD